MSLCALHRLHAYISAILLLLHPHHAKTFVTTPTTLVFASLSKISCPSLTKSAWLMNSNTTLDLSPVRMRPDGWSSEMILTVCYLSAKPLPPARIFCSLPESRRSASWLGTAAESYWRDGEP